MKLSTKGKYGTRLLLDLALYNGKRPVPLKDTAHRQQISLSYLKHLVTPLVAAGIVRCVRGARGGVSLAREPGEIKLSEVLQLLEGSVSPAECVNNPEVCSRSASCIIRDVWSELKSAIDEVLESTTLQNLVERQKKKERPDEMMYYI